MNINVWVSILLDFGSTENSPAYICCYDSPQLCDFRIIVEKLTPHIQTVDQYFPPSKFPKILTCALQCSNYKKSCTTFLIIFTSGILDLSFCPDYESQLQAFTALNIPIYTCLLDTSINCFGLVPETDVFQYFARTTGGKCSSHFEFSAPFFSDRSYVRTSQKQFSIETFPLSNTQLAFPWDPSVSIPIFCVPTRYREYEVSCPMDIIKARLRQGFMVQSVLYKSKIIIQLVLHWFSEVCVHYRLKIALDWSFARVEINVLAFSEFTLNLFKHPSHISNSLEVSSFQEFLRSLIDQDLVYKVLMETSVNSTGYNFQGNKDSYPQLIETFLRTHINWMDEYTIYLCCSKKSFLCIVEAWAKCNISEHYVYYDVDNAYFAFTALHLDEATDFYIVCHVLYYKIKSLPSELDKIFSYDGTVSVIHGPNIQLNRSLLKHTSHVYTVSSDLSYKMATISLDHFSELGYKALRSFPTSVDMVMENLQATITFHENSMSIDTYQLPKLRRTDLKQLTDKLSAMYTLGCLLDKKLPSSDPIFSIPNLLRHSNLTILGFHNKVQVPIHAFSKTLRKHVSEMCMDRPLPYSLDYEAFHNAIHQWHGMTPPICSQFESYIYISTYSVFVLHLPRHTNVPYILLFECIMNLMSLRNWASIELSPHCFGPMQKMYPLVTTFYYTSYHITTENMDLFLCDCAWQSTVECIYSLSHQLHPSHVELCIQQLSTWTITLEISLLICLFEVLHFDQSRNHSELIQSECSRFNKCVHQFMRIIPDTHYFTVLEPFIFATVSSFQSQPETCGKNLISCPTSPPLGDIDYDEEQKKAMLKEYVYPYPIQLRLSYFGLERDTTQVSSLARSMSKSLERVIKQIVLNLFLSMDPITERILDIILNELNVLDKTEFRLNVLKAASVSLIITELERFDFNGFTITRVGPYLLLLVQLNPNNMDDLDMTAITSADIEQSRELDEGDLNSLQEKETSSVASNKISGKQQKSWIILSVETEVLHVYSNVPHIREIIELMLPKLYRIVNTRVLLNQLRDSHSSSRYLIPFEENENGEEGLLQSDKDGKDAEEILDASLGEFACPIQFSFSFPIHWRLKPMVSLNSVSASLHSLSVTNRAHTFVFISNESCIYYMLLKEVSVPSASNAVAATVMNEEESASFSSPNMNIPPNTGSVVPNSFSATRNLY
ncbi:hypothetical protein HMI55_006501 [Coelomomyces lativittatus]|nr:hypothetical protein HMI55_006501 [Coelomomyces lativittatus]